MKKNQNNEELQSRREFFKKAAKSALPILGAIVLAGAPGVVKANNSSPMGCHFGCTAGCQNSCDGCSGGCSSGCQGSCYTGCYNGCRNSCQYTCSNTCSGSCSGGCARSAYA